MQRRNFIKIAGAIGGMIAGNQFSHLVKNISQRLPHSVVR